MQLKNQNHSIQVNPWGGEISSWKWKMIDLLYPATLRKDGKRRGGMPLCFPIHGKQPHDHARVKLSQHGFVRDKVHLLMRSLTKEAITSSMSYHGDDGVYPWKISIASDVELKDYGFQHSFTVHNHDKESAWTGGGLHPYIAVHGTTIVDLGGGNSFDASALESGQSKTFKITAPARVMSKYGTVSINPNDLYTHYVVWTDDPSKYICIEPVTDRTAFMNRDTGIWIQPDSSVEFLCEYTFTPFEDTQV